jgi:hypothetical protein
MPTTFIWPSVSRMLPGGRIEMKVTGYDDDGAHWTGGRAVEPADVDHRLLHWLCRWRKSLPPFFEEGLLPSIEAMLATNRDLEDAPVPEVDLPAGIRGLFVHAPWSGDSEAARRWLESLGLSGWQSMLIDEFRSRREWRHLAAFVQGKGELFVFADGNCSLFAVLGDHLHAIPKWQRLVCEHLAEPGKAGDQSPPP